MSNSVGGILVYAFQIEIVDHNNEDYFRKSPSDTTSTYDIKTIYLCVSLHCPSLKDVKLLILIDECYDLHLWKKCSE